MGIYKILLICWKFLFTKFGMSRIEEFFTGNNKKAVAKAAYNFFTSYNGNS